MLRIAALLITVAVGSGCAGANFSQLSSMSGGILNSAGLGGGGVDTNKIFEAGQKFAKGVEGLSEEEEYYLGRGVAATVLSKYQTLRNESLTRYLNKVGQTLVLVSDRPETFGGYHFVVLDTPEINALSAPGGIIFVSRGFLRIIPDEDALAAVLAHEIGHVVHGHARAAISESNISSAILTAAEQTAASQGGLVTQELTSLFGDSIHDVTSTLLTKGFSRGQEYEADEYSVELLARAGYNPNALTTVLEALKGAQSSDESGWFSTHPAPDKRLSEIQGEIPEASPLAVSSQPVRTKRFQSSVKSAA